MSGCGQEVPYIKVVVVRNDLTGDIGRQAVAAFTDAANEWNKIITNSQQPVRITSTQNFEARCGSGAILRDGDVVNGITIFASLEDFGEGTPGGTLGRAGACAFTTSGANTFPRLGLMNFDAVDVPNLLQAGTFPATILHEMGHVIGVGGQQWKQLIRNPNGAQPTFTGATARRGLELIGGGAGEPNVEQDGGPGTALGHWDEETFDNELMTGFLNDGANPNSLLTFGSLIDIGYTVDASLADSFNINNPYAGRRLNGEREVPEGLRKLREEHGDAYDHAFGFGKKESKNIFQRMLEGETESDGWEEVGVTDFSKPIWVFTENGPVEQKITLPFSEPEGFSTGVVAGAGAAGAVVALVAMAVVNKVRRSRNTEAETDDIPAL
mmetsp:Transcript_4621/g.8134  ORF Transcript_4621/g.8134 Transcript_4621/m.8134 type:complete len:382 (-) Transcript_4621:74-1219(-)|eukprot:CAMPEP_0184556082 /NCGR_PEP_ID=MMETSP0199_2-20130426/39142_1 /TAXON_ID=1112570 /ORGANISM="Thraustochytrium sp., Strain LLF1b" /LENGTH=381 /DNA_ID=CAMNT_0026952589 /DNA_START=164 /DNA_END=1309 /DNA_ORIENTATION=+